MSVGEVGSSHTHGSPSSFVNGKFHEHWLHFVEAHCIIEVRSFYSKSRDTKNVQRVSTRMHVLEAHYGANMTYPYTLVSCPCTDITQTGEGDEQLEDQDDGEEEHTFDPSSPRANYSLYPLDHLLYCEDCQQMRCPRCTIEEIVCWFCPNCLFEMPTSVVKSEGGR